MKFKKLGKTNLNSSKIILGGGAVGGIVFKDGLEKGLFAVKEAINCGINWIDSAPAYGGGVSEKYIGEILKELDKNPIISTKVGIPIDQMDNCEYIIMSSIEKSLETLSLDKVDVFQLHNKVTDLETSSNHVTSNDLFRKNGILDTMQKIKDRGLASNIGFTGLGGSNTLKSMILDGRFDMMQAYVNLLNPSALYKSINSKDQADYIELINLANSKEMGVVAIRVLAAGVLAGVKNIKDTKPLSDGSNFPLEYKRLEKLKKELNLDDSEIYNLALKFVFNSDELGIGALGFAKLEHMYKAIEVLEDTNLDKELIQRFKNAYESGVLY